MDPDFVNCINHAVDFRALKPHSKGRCPSNHLALLPPSPCHYSPAIFPPSAPRPMPAQTSPSARPRKCHNPGLLWVSRQTSDQDEGLDQNPQDVSKFERMDPSYFNTSGWLNHSSKRPDCTMKALVKTREAQDRLLEPTERFLKPLKIIWRKLLNYV